MWKLYVMTVEGHLRKVVLTHQRDLGKRLPLFLLVRASIYEITGMTPASMVFRRTTSALQHAFWGTL
jgi:hypothetical protein